MYTINWSSKAKKQLRKIDSKNQESIIDAVDALKDFPNTRNVSTLTRHVYGYRMRVGSYRVLFDADTKVNIIEIEQVKRRNEKTY